MVPVTTLDRLEALSSDDPDDSPVEGEDESLVPYSEQQAPEVSGPVVEVAGQSLRRLPVHRFGPRPQGSSRFEAEILVRVVGDEKAGDSRSKFEVAWFGIRGEPANADGGIVGPDTALEIDPLPLGLSCQWARRPVSVAAWRRKNE